MSAIGVDSLSGLAAFVRAAETRSFVAAGRLLGVSSSAVGKSVARLEERLGVRLFHRSTRSIRLTPEGELFFERCQRILADLGDAEAELSHAREAPRGKLRIGVPAIGNRLLGPVLPEFRRRYPEVELDIDYDDHLVDVIEEGLDAVVRSGDLVDSRLSARRLGTFRFLVVGSPDYLRERGTPRRLDDLARHACLLYRFPTTGKIQPWALHGDVPSLPVALSGNSLEALLGLAARGLGLVYAPDFAVRDELQRGALVSVLDPFTTSTGTFHVLWPAHRLLAPKLRVLVDFLGEHLFKP
ncbi:Transcriptional regulator, LysR family protein [Minicystis rosea]|nr:Transcriptional regulator, LysR family protein [Minicystis rosea]